MSGIYRGVNGSAVADALNIDGDKGDLTIGNSGLDWEINPDTVTFAKMQNISTDTVLGRATAGSGDVEEIPCTAAGRALLDDANAAAQRTTLGVVPGTDVLAYDANLQSFVNTFTLPTVDGTNGFVVTTDGAGTLSLVAPSGVADGDKGDITVSAAGTVWEIDAGVVSTTELGGDITVAGKALLDDADTSAQRTTLGLGSIATQEANNVSITGGSVTGITDLAVADGGTGASDATGARTNLGLVIGTDVQAYDVDTAKLDVAQTFIISQRAASTTDNDLSFDLSATNNFKCTPTAGGALTFTNHVAGQSGYVLLDNSGGYAITAAATTKVGAAFLANISVAGIYLISYYDDGTNAYCTASGALS